MAITPTIAGLVEQIADLKAKVERLSRPRPAPTPFGRKYRVVYTASNSITTDAVSVVGGWTMTGGTDQGVTVSTDSTGVTAGLLTLPAGLWRADVFWNNSGGGYALTDSCDYWLAPDSGAQYFGTSFRPGYFTASSTAAGEVDVPGGGTLKIVYYSTFDWTRDLTMSLRRVG